MSISSAESDPSGKCFKCSGVRTGGSQLLKIAGQILGKIGPVIVKERDPFMATFVSLIRARRARWP
jgi:hypothetical protein